MPMMHLITDSEDELHSRLRPHFGTLIMWRTKLIQVASNFHLDTYRLKRRL